MKKRLTLILTMIFLCIPVLFARAATGEIPVAQILGSTNTAPVTPVQYLCDNHPETIWRTGNDSPGTAWAELDLAATVLIDGLQIYGPFTGKLTVEYWQDGGWHSFLTAKNLTGETAGWQRIDLSYDRIATDKLRLWIANAESSGFLGGIGEVRVLGRDTQETVNRLDPTNITGNDFFKNAPAQMEGWHLENPGEYLFDHNTYTGWPLYPSDTAISDSVAELGEVCFIQRIKVFGSNSASPDGSGQLHFQYRSDGKWVDIPGLTGIDLSQINLGWHSFDLSGLNLSTDAIRVLLSGDINPDALKEVEIWGCRNIGSSYLYIGSGSALLSNANPVNYSFTLAKPKTGTIYLQIAGSGSHAFQLQGLEVVKPFGADHLIVISTNAPIDAIAAAFSNSKLDAAELLRLLETRLEGSDSTVAIQPLYTRERGQSARVAGHGVRCLLW